VHISGIIEALPSGEINSSIRLTKHEENNQIKHQYEALKASDKIIVIVRNFE
jgi:hypothetical protein